MKKEIISTFRENPKTKVAWWAMGLGLATFFSPTIMGIFAAVVRPMIDRATNETTGARIGFSFVIIPIGLVFSALVTSILAYKKGERSWAMWLGLVPATLGVLFWALMVVGEFVFPH